MLTWRSQPRRSFCRVRSRSATWFLHASDGFVFGHLPLGTVWVHASDISNAGVRICHLTFYVLDLNKLGHSVGLYAAHSNYSCKIGGLTARVVQTRQFLEPSFGQAASPRPRVPLAISEGSSDAARVSKRFAPHGASEVPLAIRRRLGRGAGRQGALKPALSSSHAGGAP